MVNFSTDCWTKSGQPKREEKNFNSVWTASQCESDEENWWVLINLASCNSSDSIIPTPKTFLYSKHIHIHKMYTTHTHTYANIESGMKGNRIKESLNVSDLIIFISTFVYRKSIGRFSAVCLCASIYFANPFKHGVFTRIVISSVSSPLDASVPLPPIATMATSSIHPSICNDLRRPGPLMVLLGLFDVMVIQNGILNWQIVYLLLFPNTRTHTQGDIHATPWQTHFKMTFFSSEIRIVALFLTQRTYKHTNSFCYTFITFWWFVFVIISKHFIEIDANERKHRKSRKERKQERKKTIWEKVAIE